jgi:CTP synthase
VINVHDCPTIYHVPLVLKNQGLVELLRDQLQLCVPALTRKFMFKWRNLAERAEHLRKVIVFRKYLRNRIS